MAVVEIADEHFVEIFVMLGQRLFIPSSIYCCRNEILPMHENYILELAYYYDAMHCLLVS